MNDSVDYQISEPRAVWMRFYEENELPVPESNPIMMTISSSLCHCLMDHIAYLQSCSASTTSSSTQEVDGDYMYYRFGGAAISDMLHLHYKQIKACQDDQRDVLSQEISILHCMNSRNKVTVPSYLKYRDQEYMYFPDPVMILFNSVSTQVAHERIQGQRTYSEAFREALSSKLPKMAAIYSNEAISNVFNTFTRKLCNTRIQEFLSATKQHLATKKGLTLTVDINLRTTLLAHHTKLETKLGNNN